MSIDTSDAAVLAAIKTLMAKHSPVALRARDALARVHSTSGADHHAMVAFKGERGEPAFDRWLELYANEIDALWVLVAKLSEAQQRPVT